MYTAVFLALFVGLCGYGYTKINLKKIIDIIDLVSKVLNDNKQKPCEIKVENSIGHINLGNKKLTLPAFKSSKHYDIICFKHHENFSAESHDASLNVSEDHKVPFTLIRNNEHLLHVPFKPSDMDLNSIFVGIKNITNEGYSVYKFDEHEFINFFNIIQKYEEEQKSKASQPVELAEAYDD